MITFNNKCKSFATKRLIHVSYLQRKPRPKQNFSLEYIFDDLRHRLSGDIRPTVHRAPFYSNGLIRRALIACSATLHQGDLNHITGDINFASLLLSRKRTLLTILDAGVMHGKYGIRKALLDWLWFRLLCKLFMRRGFVMNYWLVC